MQRCDELGAISDSPDFLMRTFHSPAMARVNQRVGTWMRQAGLEVREDAVFNIVGRRLAARRQAKTFLLGSHLDTVRDAGKYDGPLGVLIALAVVESLRKNKVDLPFHVEIIGFSDEEGLRYQAGCLGSRAVAGTLTAAELARIEESQIVQARRRPSEFLGYAEVHIEQGPVLEQKNLPVGIVKGIVGQSRLRVELLGRAGHAGTVPMNLRHDALAGAAEFVLAVERAGVTATVGQLEVQPGASNVIPGRVSLSLDVRDASDARRRGVVRALRTRALAIVRRRGLKLRWTPIQETDAVACDKMMSRIFSSCVSRRGLDVAKLSSGAGHDAAALSAICPVAMLFVRCRGGISHHPSESVKSADVKMAINLLADFIRDLAARQKHDSIKRRAVRRSSR